MKLVVINFSGNVGKTTISGHMLKPRMADAPLISVESLNVDASADGVDASKMRAKRFGDLLEQVIQESSTIVDVGASNAETFLKMMQQYDGSHEEFDRYIVPVVKERKQQADTVNTIRALAQLGVPREKICTVFNKVEPEDSIRDDFAAIFGLAAAEGSFKVNAGAVIYANEVFERMKGLGKSLADITADPTDYRAMLKDLTDSTERERCVRMMSLKRLATSANRNLSDAFTALAA